MILIIGSIIKILKEHKASFLKEHKVLVGSKASFLKEHKVLVGSKASFLNNWWLPCSCICITDCVLSL